MKSIENRITSEFKSELKLWANEIYYKALMDVENVKALASRTVIRIKLYEYHHGQSDLNSVREFTCGKYEEGTSVYKDIIFAKRTDVKGNTIAEYNNGDRQKPETENDAQMAFYKSEQGYNVVIKNDITHNDVVIGKDEAAFFLFEPNSVRSDLIGTVFVNNYELNNTKISEYSLSVPIGDTGAFLYSELRQQALNDEKRKNVRPVLIESLILFAAVFIISYFTIFRLFMTLMGRLDIANARLTSSLKERELLIQEQRHRIKNNLAFISSYISLQEAPDDDEETVYKRLQLLSKIEAISLVYDKLDTGVLSQQTDIGTYLQDLCLKVIETSHIEGVILTAEPLEKVVLPSKKTVTLGLVFSELIMNSLKHAKDEDDLEIFIGMESFEEELRLYYDDDGKPYPADVDFDSGGSMGMMVIKSLTEQLGGRLEYNFRIRKRIEFVFSMEALSLEN